MYTKDLNNRITLRLDDDTFNFIIKLASLYNDTPSAVIRTTLEQLRRNCEEMERKVRSHVDDKADFDDKL